MTFDEECHPKRVVDMNPQTMSHRGSNNKKKNPFLQVWKMVHRFPKITWIFFPSSWLAIWISQRRILNQGVAKWQARAKETIETKFYVVLSHRVA